MRILFRIFTGFLSSFVFILAIVLAIPMTRNIIFDEIAKHSNYNESQVEYYENLEKEYEENLNSLSEIQKKYEDAENKITQYQEQLNDKTTDIESLQSQIEDTNFKYDQANLEISNLNEELSILKQQHTDLKNQLANEIENNSENQELINSLNTHIAVLESNIANNENTISQLKLDMENYVQEIRDYSNTIAEYEQQIEELQFQIEEQRRIIENLQHDMGIDLSFYVSFDDFDVSIVNSLGKEKIFYDNDGENVVTLESLKGLDVYSLTVGYLVGSCSISNTLNSINLGEVTINPENTDISWYLWDPINQQYISFTDDNIDYLISLGYTNVGYSLYAVDYIDGILSFHINFGDFS